MKYTSIKSHLKPYSLVNKRRTTIKHAFASAIAPNDEFDVDRIREALKSLGQNPDDLQCAYCDKPAQTWDHVVNLVKDGELNGYGHQIGNLIPSCRDCNSKKGGKPVEQFLASDLERLIRIQEYLHTYAREVDTGAMRRRAPQLYDRFQLLKKQVLTHPEEADRIAAELRDLK